MNTTTVKQEWWTEFNGAFWLTISASLFAFAGLALRACLKSRCTNIVCCSGKGLVSCDREPVADEFTALPTPITPRLPRLEEGTFNSQSEHGSVR